MLLLGTGDGREFWLAGGPGADVPPISAPGGSGDSEWSDDNADASAPCLLYWFDRDIDRKIQRYHRDAKDPHDLFDPSKPDYLGTPEALAPYTGRGLLWLASNSDGDPPRPPTTVPTGDAASGNHTSDNLPTQGESAATSPEISEPAAAEAARVKAAEPRCPDDAGWREAGIQLAASYYYIASRTALRA
jgi:hypothetical protein